MTRLCILAAALLPLLTGCAPRARNLDDAVADYERGQYQSAYEKAVFLMRGGNRASPDEAAYVAGLSAFRMKRMDDATQRLSVAAESRNPLVAGRAKAALGLVRLEQDSPREAARLLVEASKLLTGREGADAAQFAGVAYQEAGEFDLAREQFETAASLYTSANAPSETGAASTTGRFALQAGAYSTLENAREAQSSARAVARKHNLGEVRIIARTDTRARTLYLVQFGDFATRDAAERMRAEIGRLEYLVSPVAHAQ